MAATLSRSSGENRMRVGILVGAALACAVIAGCNRQPAVEHASDQPFADVAITDLGKARWARTCAMCHVRGEGGAPKIGDTAAWSRRLAQGEAVVLDHVINGFGNMPPLGYCMDCERDDLRAYIHFMASGGA
jgi:cytochrome c5